MKRIVVMISGSGSNLEAIIEACLSQRINGEVVHVISNIRGIKGGCFVDSREYEMARNLEAAESNEERAFRLLVEQEEFEERRKTCFENIV